MAAEQQVATHDLFLQSRRSEQRWPAVRFILRLARTKPLGFAGLVVLLVFGIAAALAPVIAPYSYEETDFLARLEGPSRQHIFGTDNLGRDLFSRVLYGTQVSMAIAFGAVLLAKTLATLIAIVSGYYGGWLDKTIQRFVDIWLAIPTLVLLISLLGVIGPGFWSMLILIGLANVPGSSRLIRSVVVSVRSEMYMEAARAIGASDGRVLLRYVLPNIVHIIIYSATVTLGTVIILAASLGFLGYGVPPPRPDLGGMLSGAGLQFMRRAPWLAIWPGLAITMIVFAFNVFGDALRDLLDPRLRGR
ncbi:MAG: ABC transporter permease [Dehalococcoidia bacterium]